MHTGGTYATGGKTLPKKNVSKKTTGGKKTTRSADSASGTTGSVHKTGSRWGNKPGAPSDSEAVHVSHGSPRDEEEDVSRNYFEHLYAVLS